MSVDFLDPQNHATRVVAARKVYRSAKEPLQRWERLERVFEVLTGAAVLLEVLQCFPAYVDIGGGFGEPHPLPDRVVSAVVARSGGLKALPA